MSVQAAALIVGNREDAHTRAVASRLAQGGRARPVVIDAATLSHAAFAVQPAHPTRLHLPGDELVELGGDARGWLRRIAPDIWDAGVALGSRDAAVKGAWLALLSAVARTSVNEWLTDPACAAVAENKLVQYAAAASIGVSAPTTVVASDAQALAHRLGETFVVKPLGPGEVRDGDSARAVFAQLVTAGDPRLAALAGAPFLAQQHVRARRHIRAVTVGTRAWTAALDADEGMPLDWRRAASAHRAFRPAVAREVAADAARLARHLGVGYSSQDWVVDSEGQPYFLDLNPGGQWLFLPWADEVTEALASWLEGNPA